MFTTRHDNGHQIVEIYKFAAFQNLGKWLSNCTEGFVKNLLDIFENSHQLLRTFNENAA